MKRFACLFAGLALCATAVRAADDKVEVEKDANHAKIEKKHGDSETKVESKAHRRMGGGTASETVTTEKHKTPKGHTMTKKTTKSVEKDANGNVVKKEEKVSR